MIVSLVHTPSKKRIHGGGLILEESTLSQVCGSIHFYNFTCEIKKLPWQPSARLRANMATKF